MSSLKRKGAEAAKPGAAKKTANIASFFKPVGDSKPATAAKPAGGNWDKDKWAASLTPEQRELLGLEIKTLHESWLKELKDELVSPGFLNLKRFLVQEKGTVFPPPEDVYSWSRHTPLNTIKVVILGQDPYHNVNQAMGLSFSVRPPTPAPPSLVNIYKALMRDFPAFTPPPNKSGDLTPWADRGVLLLNAALTVRAHQANSHANKGWEHFTGKVLDVVNKKRPGVVFMAWGKAAEKRVAGVDRKRHLVLTGVHPSPLSAHRGWFDCGHFKKANEWLQEKYGVEGPVDWSLHGPPVGVPEERMSKEEQEKVDEEEKAAEKGVKEEVPAQVIENDVDGAEDEFDEDEEAAMLEATREAEKMFSSQGAPATSEKVDGLEVADGKNEEKNEEAGEASTEQEGEAKQTGETNIRESEAS